MSAESAVLFEQIREVIHEEVSRAVNQALGDEGLANLKEAFVSNGGTIYLNTPEAAKYLGVSKQYLEGARHRGQGPPYSRLVRRIKYTRADLDAWMASRRLDPEGA